MKTNKVTNRFKIEDYLLLISLLLQDAGTFGFLPLNLSQIIIIFLCFILIIKLRSSNYKMYMPKNVILFFIYIFAITFLNVFDVESIKGICFFVLQTITIFLYLSTVEDYSKIYKIMYITAFILSCYGIIQTIAYYAEIPTIYDMSLYGFAVNNSYVGKNGIFRPSSLYSEPAHLTGILISGIYIGLVNEQDEKHIKKWKTLIIFIFSVLTKSTITYISLAMILIYYFIIYKKAFFKNFKWICLIVIITSIILSNNPRIMNEVMYKFKSLKTADPTYSSDASGFAIISNLKIAFNKMKDGYLFGTGYDSHRLYYYKYIDNLYSNVLFYLNVDEAASLYTRIFSEFGIIGLIAFITFCMNKLIYSIKTKNKDLMFFTILLLIIILRNGSYVYIINSLSFSVLICHKKIENNRSEKKHLDIAK